jgi:hypothetical protein
MKLRDRLGDQVRTEELSWDSAMWVGGGGTVVAALQDDEKTAKLSFDQGDSVALSVGATQPADVASAIVARLGSRTA